MNSAISVAGSYEGKWVPVPKDQLVALGRLTTVINAPPASWRRRQPASGTGPPAQQDGDGERKVGQDDLVHGPEAGVFLQRPGA
jgi:hypothetical protein